MFTPIHVKQKSETEMKMNRQQIAEKRKKKTAERKKRVCIRKGKQIRGYARLSQEFELFTVDSYSWVC